MKAIISIIVPIYNMEMYIERCLHSLLTQTFKKLKLLPSMMVQPIKRGTFFQNIKRRIKG